MPPTPTPPPSERASEKPPASKRTHALEEERRARILGAGREFIKKNVELLLRLAKQRLKLADVVFLDVVDVKVLHAEAIAATGGSAGIRDQGLLESAVMRVRAGYYDTLADLAAAYAFGLAKNHAFIDGNKRIAIIAAGAFLGANGFPLTLDPDKWEPIMLGVADGSISQDTLALLFELETGAGPIRVEP